MKYCTVVCIITEPWILADTALFALIGTSHWLVLHEKREETRKLARNQPVSYSDAGTES
jgi:hypothetical protein